MLRKLAKNSISLLIFALALVVLSSLSACGGGGGGGGSATVGVGAYKASGIYVYTIEDAQLSLTTISTNYPEGSNGPNAVGTELFSVVMNDTTFTMTADADAEVINWTKMSGAVNDIVGSWRGSVNGSVVYSAFFNPDGSFSFFSNQVLFDALYAPAEVFTNTIMDNEAFDFSIGQVVAVDGAGDMLYSTFTGGGLLNSAFSSANISVTEGATLVDFDAFLKAGTHLPAPGDWAISQTVFDTLTSSVGKTLWVKTLEGFYAIIFIESADETAMTFKWSYPYGDFAP